MKRRGVLGSQRRSGGGLRRRSRAVGMSGGRVRLERESIEDVRGRRNLIEDVKVKVMDERREVVE